MAGERQNVSIKLSYDEGVTWPVNKSLEPGWSSYSDLAVCRSGAALCFYERAAQNGEDSGHNSRKRGILTIARFNLEWLTDGRDSSGPGGDSGPRKEPLSAACCPEPCPNNRRAPFPLETLPVALGWPRRGRIRRRAAARALPPKAPRSVDDRVFNVWTHPGRFTKNPDVIQLASGRLLLVYSDTESHFFAGRSAPGSPRQRRQGRDVEKTGGSRQPRSAQGRGEARHAPDQPAQGRTLDRPDRPG